MSGDMALFFNGIADGSDFISVPHRDYKPIAKRNDNFYLVMCGNTWGKGSIEYSGRDFQDCALMDRFRLCRHYVDYHHELEKALSGDWYLFITFLRKLLENYGSYLSTRNVEDIMKLINSDNDIGSILNMLIEDLSQADKNSFKDKIKGMIELKISENKKNQK